MAAVFPIRPVWDQPGSSRIPFWAYTDAVSYTHLTLPTKA